MTIEQCLLHGLKRSALGLFRANTTMGLLQKISKDCKEAELVLKYCQEYDQTFNSNYSKTNSFGNLSTNDDNSNIFQLSRYTLIH